MPLNTYMGGRSIKGSGLLILLKTGQIEIEIEQKPGLFDQIQVLFGSTSGVKIF